MGGGGGVLLATQYRYVVFTTLYITREGKGSAHPERESVARAPIF